MVPAVSADDARRRSDEAVRRIRQESGRRAAERSRVRAFSSWCAVATLASGISLAALDAHDAAVRRAAARRGAAASVAALEGCGSYMITPDPSWCFDSPTTRDGCGAAR